MALPWQVIDPDFPSLREVQTATHNRNIRVPKMHTPFIRAHLPREFGLTACAFCVKAVTHG